MSDIGDRFCSLFSLHRLLRLQSQRVWNAGDLALNIHTGLIISVVVCHQLLLTRPSSCSELLGPHHWLRLRRDNIVWHESVWMNDQELGLDFVLMKQIVKNVRFHQILLKKLPFWCYIPFLLGLLANFESLMLRIFKPFSGITGDFVVFCVKKWLKVWL